jgi:transposase-like protein
MVQRLSGPRAISANALSDEVGIPQGTLSRWLKQASTVGLKMNAPDDDVDKDNDSSTTAPTSKRAQDWSAEEKVALVLEAAATPAAELGALLRRRGVHEAQLDEWRKQMTEGVRSPGRAERKATAAETQRIRQLERELKRKDKALAETAALLVLKKKAQAIWGDEDDDTDPKNEE